jgi:hypothetical protein
MPLVPPVTRTWVPVKSNVTVFISLLSVRRFSW